MHRYTVRSVLGGRLLRGSRTVLTVTGAAYAAAIIAGGTAYVYHTSRLKQIQPVPDDWTFLQRIIALAGANHHQEGNYEQTIQYYERLVQQLTADSPDLSTKNAAWLGSYSDVLARMGLCYEHVGEEVKSKEALEAALAIPFGQKTLKAQAYLQLGLHADDTSQELQYYLQSIASLGSFYDLETGAVKVMPETVLDNDTAVQALLSIGRVYVQQGRQQEALALFLSTLRAIRTATKTRKYTDAQCGQALSMARIAELVWAAGQKQEAIVWSEGAYYEAQPQVRNTETCRSCAELTAQLTAKMYRNLGLVEPAEKFEQLAGELQCT